MLNVVGKVREFISVNFQSLPPNWQYALVAAVATCLPVLQQAIITALSAHRWNWAEVAEQCSTAMVSAHFAQRLCPPRPSDPSDPKCKGTCA